MVGLSLNEAVHPGLTHAVGVKVSGEILYHLSRQRQRSLCEVLDIAYELGFLLWVECKLIKVLGGSGALTALVSSAQRRVRYVEAAGNCAV